MEVLTTITDWSLRSLLPTFSLSFLLGIETLDLNFFAYGNIRNLITDMMGPYSDRDTI